MHWAEAYVGEPYVKGTNDCGALAERVARDRFGKIVNLPKARGHGLREQSQQIIDMCADYGDPVDEPQEGDAVIMYSRGMLSHVGVYCVVNGEPHVLHAVKNAGQVCLHKLRHLVNLGLRIEGFYRWK